jgi:TonB family protein
MAKTNNQPTSVEDVLRRIEAREQKKSRRRMVVLGLVAAGVIGTGAVGYQFFDRKPAGLPTFAYADLSADGIPNVLSANANAILVNHPDLGTDTVRSLSDYEMMTRLVELSRMMDQQQTQVANPDTANRLAPFVIDIAGSREAGQPLTFTIEEYDEEVEYMLDFGNGYRRKVDQRSVYRYPMPGSFEIKLLATKGESSSLYQKRFRINSAPQVAEIELPQRQSTPPPSSNNSSSRASRQEPVIQDMMDADPELFAAGDAAPMPVTKVPQQLSNNETASPMAQPIASKPVAAAPAPVEAPSLSLSQPLMISEIEPVFPGGNSAMIRHIQRNYQYPREARDRKIEGVVVIRFVVNADGSLTGFNVVRGIGYGCDEEAMRLIKSMPNWIAGEQNGTKVPVYRTIPITFRLLN